MNITATTATTASQNEPARLAARENNLGQDTFLQLLVSQLQHQDPTSPKDDLDFIAQLAQFSSLEQLTEIASSMRSLVEALGASPTQRVAQGGPTAPVAPASSNTAPTSTGGGL